MPRRYFCKGETVLKVKVGSSPKTCVKERERSCRLSFVVSHQHQLNADGQWRCLSMAYRQSHSAGPVLPGCLPSLFNSLSVKALPAGQSAWFPHFVRPEHNPPDGLHRGNMDGENITKGFQPNGESALLETRPGWKTQRLWYRIFMGMSLSCV